MNMKHSKHMQKYTQIVPYFWVDTYDVLHSGIPNTIRVQNEVLTPWENE